MEDIISNQAIQPQPLLSGYRIFSRKLYPVVLDGTPAPIACHSGVSQRKQKSESKLKGMRTARLRQFWLTRIDDAGDRSCLSVIMVIFAGRTGG